MIRAWLVRIARVVGMFTCGWCLPQLALATDGEPLRLNLKPGVSPISRDIYDLHMTIFWICVVIGVIVFGVLIYALVKHRKSVKHKAQNFHSSFAIEMIWTLIPIVILVAMAIPATLVLIRMDDDSKSDINIKIIGYQWKWKYEYLDNDISFFSNLSTPRAQIEGKEKKGKWYLLEVDKPLVLPIHKKIRFLVTSNDVIHSWWVPALGVKRDAIPGFIHEAWTKIEKPGVYRGQCAELCGMHHGFMPIVVVAKTQDDYQKWVQQNSPAAQKALAAKQPKKPVKPMTTSELMALGKKTYETYCSVCHKANGAGMPPAFPALVGSKLTVGPVAGQIDIVLNGKTGTAMQAFKDQLDDKQIAAVITYERNSWGNDNKSKYGKQAGGLVQPADIAKARAGE